jgi:hypothetical protein
MSIALEQPRRSHSPQSVIPAKAGIYPQKMDPRHRGGESAYATAVLDDALVSEV